MAKESMRCEDDWLDYRLEHHPEFLRRVAARPRNAAE
jgi:hypothetical protein